MVAVEILHVKVVDAPAHASANVDAHVRIGGATKWAGSKVIFAHNHTELERYAPRDGR
jgi:hypothetical protein